MQEAPPTPAPLDLTVRVGCSITYECAAATPALITLQPASTDTQRVIAQQLTLGPGLSSAPFTDDHGNVVSRTCFRAGANTLHYDAIVHVPSRREDVTHADGTASLLDLPPSLLRYTLPSRYCDSDKLLDFAWREFGHLPHGLPRVLGIRDWLHRHIAYRTGSGSPNLSAHDILQRRYGVCRDLAHGLVALCRTFNLPARYVSGFVPDIGWPDPGTPQDFHAYAEVYLAGRWQVFDARFLTPRVGRIRISAGCDAVGSAFATIYGAATLTHFEVWTYQINPAEVRLGDPIDLSRRLCGTSEIRRA